MNMPHPHYTLQDSRWTLYHPDTGRSQGSYATEDEMQKQSFRLFGEAAELREEK